MNVETRELKSEGTLKDMPTTNPLLVLISAPSGGGKTTISQQLLAARPQMTRAVTCTTRPPRAGERDGVDYYFLDAASFLKRVQAGNFLEQEMNRQENTIGSKANDSSISREVVTLKAELEKFREQAQNVE